MAGIEGGPHGKAEEAVRSTDLSRPRRERQTALRLHRQIRPEARSRQGGSKSKEDREAGEMRASFPRCDEYVDRYLAEYAELHKDSSLIAASRGLRRFREDFVGRSLDIPRSELKDWMNGGGSGPTGSQSQGLPPHDRRALQPRDRRGRCSACSQPGTQARMPVSERTIPVGATHRGRVRSTARRVLRVGRVAWASSGGSSALSESPADAIPGRGVAVGGRGAGKGAGARGWRCVRWIGLRSAGCRWDRSSRQ